MPYCEKCGNKATGDDAQFCARCGSALTRQEHSFEGKRRPLHEALPPEPRTPKKPYRMYQRILAGIGVCLLGLIFIPAICVVFSAGETTFCELNASLARLEPLPADGSPPDDETGQRMGIAVNDFVDSNPRTLLLELPAHVRPEAQQVTQLAEQMLETAETLANDGRPMTRSDIALFSQHYSKLEQAANRMAVTCARLGSE